MTAKRRNLPIVGIWWAVTMWPPFLLAKKICSLYVLLETHEGEGHAYILYQPDVTGPNRALDAP